MNTYTDLLDDGETFDESMSLSDTYESAEFEEKEINFFLDFASNEINSECSLHYLYDGKDFFPYIELGEIEEYGGGECTFN